MRHPIATICVWVALLWCSSVTAWAGAHTTFVPPRQGIVMAVGRTLVVGQGLSLVANTLELPDNRLAVLFPQMPLGTAVTKIGPDGRAASTSVFRSPGWDHPNETLEPGEGAIFFNPSTWTVVVEYDNSQGYARRPITLPAGISLVGERNMIFTAPPTNSMSFAAMAGYEGNTNIVFALNQWTGIYLDPQDGDVVTTISARTRLWTRHTYRAATGWDRMPVVQGGQAFFVQTRHPRTIQPRLQYYFPGSINLPPDDDFLFYASQALLEIQRGYLDGAPPSPPVPPPDI